MTLEIWKDITSFEGLYQVSNLGNVLSLDRIVNSVIGVNGKKLIKGRILQPNDNGAGYKYVTLSFRSVKFREYIHRLVAFHFIDNPYDKDEVNHINGDKSDNSAENLEWVTGYENKQHSYKTGLSKGKSSIVSTAEGNMIIDLIKTKKYPYSDIRRTFNVTQSFIDKLLDSEVELGQKYEDEKSNRKNTTGIKISVYCKGDKSLKEFDSAAQASKYFSHHDSYFSELMSRGNFENAKYKVKKLR